MKTTFRVWFVLVFAVFMPAGARSDVPASLSEQQQDSLQSILSILLVIYDNDLSQIPADPNSIMALETSENPRDQLASALFTLMRHAIDPNAVDLTEQFSVDAAVSLDASSKVSLDSEAAVSGLDGDGAVGSLFCAMETIEEIDNPLGSCVLVPGTYRIQSLPLQIEGHVVMPAGVRLIAPYDPNTPVIEVMPGGLLDTGRAAFYADEDYPGVLPPVEIIPEDPNHFYFWHNRVGIYVHRGADPKTRLENLEITGCTVGIIIDEKLDYPLRHIVTVLCYDGVHLYAPAGIIDCQFWYNGSVFYWMIEYIFAHWSAYMNGTLFDSIAPYGGVGIYVRLDGEAYPCPEVFIDRTLSLDGDVGLYVEAVVADPNLPDPNVLEPLVPRIHSVNSCFAFSIFYGVYQPEGNAEIDVQYSAFGFNGSDTNIDLPFTGCVGLSSDPFHTVNAGNRLYINPRSPLTDAGYGVAEDGTGTCHYWPDTGRMDIGCHFPLGVSGGFGIPSSPADFNWDGVVDALDLELMEMCMGAMTDPNIVKLDLNYDSRVNMPDYGVFAFDYGYSIDPNESFNNDPNCTRSDFDGDGRVDLADMATLAEHWLTVVFDDYRLCSLCNLHTAADPNDPNAPSGAEVIDYRDRDAFMAEWGVRYASDPNIVIEQTPSMVSVSVENPEPAWKISAFLDHDLIGQWEAGGLGSTAFDADLTRYGPGAHKVTIVRCIGYGQEISEYVVSDPNSVGLYFADIPDAFEPNEPYFVRGFNLGDDLHLEITDIRDEVIYDANVPSGAIALSLPYTVFGEQQLCQVNLFDNSTASGGQCFWKTVYERFDKEDYEGRRIRAVVLLPDISVARIFSKAIKSWINALDQLGTSYVVLSTFGVEKENLRYLFSEMPGRRIIIYFGHANSHIEDIQRTRFQCYERRTTRWGHGGWPTITPMPYYAEVSACSYTKHSILGAEPLPLVHDPYTDPRPLDDVCLDIYGLNLSETPKIDQAYFFGCLSAKYADLARSFGAFSLHNAGSHDQIYMGFTKSVTQGSGWLWGGVADNLIEGLAIIGEELAKGKTLQQAVAKTEAASRGVKEALWGLNGFMDSIPGGDDVVFVYGYGYLSKIYLR